MTFYTQWKCFKSLKKDKCVDWRKGSTCISEENCTDFCNKCCRTCCLCEADAVVAWVWFNQWREFAGCFPVKLTAVYDNTTDGCSVSADELCCWMNNDICAIFDWTDKVWCTECIINYKRNLVFVCNLCNFFDINDIGIWIAECFDEYCLCVVLNGISDFI